MENYNYPILDKDTRWNCSDELAPSNSVRLIEARDMSINPSNLMIALKDENGYNAIVDLSMMIDDVGADSVCKLLVMFAETYLNYIKIFNLELSLENQSYIFNLIMNQFGLYIRPARQ